MPVTQIYHTLYFLSHIFIQWFPTFVQDLIWHQLPPHVVPIILVVLIFFGLTELCILRYKHQARSRKGELALFTLCCIAWPNQQCWMTIARYTLATKLNSTRSTLLKVDCWRNEQQSGLLPTGSTLLLIRSTLLPVSATNRQQLEFNSWSRDFVADTVIFVASVYGAKATQLTLSTFNLLQVCTGLNRHCCNRSHNRAALKCTTRNTTGPNYASARSSNLSVALCDLQTSHPKSKWVHVFQM